MNPLGGNGPPKHNGSFFLKALECIGDNVQ